MDNTEKAVGILLRESGTGKIEFWAIGLSGGSSIIWADKYDNATTRNSTRAFTAISGISHPTFLEIEYDGTNYFYRLRFSDGSMYQPSSSYQFAKNNFFTTAADQIGIFSENDASIATTLICGGFYRVATSGVL